MYKVCVYEYVNKGQLKKVDEFKVKGLIDIIVFLELYVPVDFKHKITIDFVKDGE